MRRNNIPCFEIAAGAGGVATQRNDVAAAG